MLALTVAFRADSRRACGVLVLSSLAAVVGVLNAFWLRRIVEAASAGDVSAAFGGAASIGLTAGLGKLAHSAATRMQFPLKEKTGLYLDRRLVALVGGIPTIEHHEHPVYLDRIDVLRREMYVLGFAGMHTAGAVGLLVQVITTGILLVSVYPLLLLVPVFAVPSLWAGGKAERIRQAALDATADRTRRARHLFDLATTSTAAKELRVSGLAAELVQRHRTDWEETDGLLDGAAWRGLAWTASGWVLFGLGYGAAIGLIAAQALGGQATLGDVVLALALVAQVNGQVSAASGTTTAFVRMVRVADRLVWLSGYAAACRVTTKVAVPAPCRLLDGIHLRGVTFRYPGTATDVLAGLDLSLQAGTTVAIVGDNGAGKSSLVKLLCRLYEPTVGGVTVDGVDLASIDVEEWRARVSAGFQDFARLELQAGHTIGIGDLPFLDDASAVRAALERAASSDVVSELPQGLRTQLGTSFDAGVQLSGGQWQKLALARALMRPAPLLLVLDEPTAALDAETEHKLFVRFASMTSTLSRSSGTITVLVSHRFSTVRMADLIVVLDAGRIVGAGSHDELMAVTGLYSELYELQAQAYR